MVISTTSSGPRLPVSLFLTMRTFLCFGFLSWYERRAVDLTIKLARFLSPLCSFSVSGLRRLSSCFLLLGAGLSCSDLSPSF